MSKRFTSTEKWNKAWFRRLSPEIKCVWLFLCDRCDHAGIWEIDNDALNFFINSEINLNDAIEKFEGRAEIIGDKLFLKSFIEFQYGTLNPENRVHLSVINRLEKLKNKPLISPLKGSKDKDKDKDKDNSKKEIKQNFDFESAYFLYPLKKGKTDGLKKLAKEIKTQNDFDSFVKAVQNYSNEVKANKTEPKFIKHFSTFCGSWRDWVDYVPAVKAGFENTRQDMIDDFNEELNKLRGQGE